MKRRGKSRGWLMFAVFVLLISVGGYALNAAGYVDSPFDQISFLSNWVVGGEGRFAQDFGAGAALTDFSLPSTTDGTTGGVIDLTSLSDDDGDFELPALDSLDGAATGGTASLSGNAFDEPEDTGYPADLSDIGSVLYDLWFICATTAVFIVVQWIFKLAIRGAKRRTPVMAGVK